MRDSDGRPLLQTVIGNWGWGLPHSEKTWSAGYGPYWEGSADAAYVASKSLWKQELAVENSGGLVGGLGLWHGDMMPFAGKQFEHFGLDIRLANLESITLFQMSS